MMWYWGGGVHWWGWLFGFIVMVVFWGLVIWGVWYLVSSLSRRPVHPPAAPPPHDDPRRILDARLARGEISVDEYQRLRHTLETGAPAGPPPSAPAASSPAPGSDGAP